MGAVVFDENKTPACAATCKKLVVKAVDIYLGNINNWKNLKTIVFKGSYNHISGITNCKKLKKIDASTCKSVYKINNCPNLEKIILFEKLD